MLHLRCEEEEEGRVRRVNAIALNGTFIVVIKYYVHYHKMILLVQTISQIMTANNTTRSKHLSVFVWLGRRLDALALHEAA